MKWNWKRKRGERKLTKREKVWLLSIIGLLLLYFVCMYGGNQLNHFVINKNGYMPVIDSAANHFTPSVDKLVVSPVTGDTYMFIGSKSVGTYSNVVNYGFIESTTKFAWLSDIFHVRNNKEQYQYFSLGDILQGINFTLAMNGYWRY